MWGRGGLKVSGGVLGPSSPLRTRRTLLLGCLRERSGPEGRRERGALDPRCASERPGFGGPRGFTSSSKRRARSHVLASTRSFQWGKGSETERRKPWSLTASGKRWVGGDSDPCDSCIAPSRRRPLPPPPPGPGQDAVMHVGEGKMCRQVDLEAAIRESAPATPGL